MKLADKNKHDITTVLGKNVHTIVRKFQIKRNMMNIESYTKKLEI